MAGGSFFALLDDIATLLDDISVMTKTAATRTAGVLGDDLALNAEQVAGVSAKRELPVVWAVAMGSLLNKAILVPTALLISAFVPWLVAPLMMAGGTFLCFEGAEKLLHHGKPEATPATEADADAATFEKRKVRGAIGTDFILSAEIVVITLGTVAGAPLSRQVTVLVLVAFLMTVGVYGVVAAIVKLDDAGLWLVARTRAGVVGRVARGVGRFLLAFAPWLMKALTVVGTAAMFLVGGGILLHGVTPAHHFAEAVAAHAGWFKGLVNALFGGLSGLLAGAVALAVVSGVRKLRAAFAPSA